MGGGRGAGVGRAGVKLEELWPTPSVGAVSGGIALAYLMPEHERSS